MIKLNDLLSRVSKVIDCVFIFDPNDEFDYVFYLDKPEDVALLDKWLEAFVVDWGITIDRSTKVPFLYISNWKF